MFISQLIRYARACSSYDSFILGAARLSCKLLGQGYVRGRLKSSLRKFYGRYRDLLKHYKVPFNQMLHAILGHDHIQWHPPLMNRDLITELDLISFWRHYLIPGGFHMTFVTGAASQQRTLHLLLRTPGPVPFGTCICSNVDTILSRTCHVLRTFWISNIPRYFYFV